MKKLRLKRRRDRKLAEKREQAQEKVEDTTVNTSSEPHEEMKENPESLN